MIDVAESNVEELKSCKKRNHIEQADRITNLPDATIHHIFCFLSLIDIVRTSVLSRRWRYVWTEAPNLIFDDALVDKENLFATIVHGVQKLYKSPNIEKYTLSVQQPSNINLVGACVRFAVKRNVKELYVNTLSGKPFQMPWCRALKKLELDLQDGEAVFPLTGCFSSLETFSVSRAVFTDDANDAIVDVISSRCPRLQSLNLKDCIGLIYFNITCPTLEDLNIERCVGLNQLHVSAGKLQILSVKHSFTYESKTHSVTISAPNLRTFKWLDYIIEDFHIRTFTSLKSAHVSLVFDYYPEEKKSYIRSARKFLSHLARAKSLIVEMQCFWGISTHKEMLEGLSTPLCNLKHLTVLLGHDKHAYQGISHLFYNCSNLEVLYVIVADDETQEILDNQFPDASVLDNKVFKDYQRAPLNHLLEFKIHGFRGTKYEIEFVHFMLEYAVILERIIICFSHVAFLDENIKTEIKKQLVDCMVTSPKADIFFN